MEGKDSRSRATSTAEPAGGPGRRRGKGVVDANLRVLGVTGLRVADASVFPCIPSGPIAATCMAVGEAAFRLLMHEDKRWVRHNGKEED